MRYRFLIAFAAGLGALPAGAADWAADPATSRMGFIYQRADAPAPGSFERFSGWGRFDPTRPNEAELRLEIETRSIALGSLLESAFATSAEWFDSGEHPVAVYELARLTPLSGDRYEALGTLTIKGRSQVVTSEIELEVTDGLRARASGSLMVNRRDFGLGVGPISAFVTIGDEVTVTFDLAATLMDEPVSKTE